MAVQWKSPPVINVYKYLGICFSTKLRFTTACKDLASQGKRNLLIVLKKLRLLNNNAFDLFIKIFDAQIQHTVLYGAEIWGLDAAVTHCESVHLFALKQFLGLDRRTPTDLVYSETNRYPLSVNAAVRCIRYWVKILHMDECRLPFKSYQMLYDLDVKGKSTWASQICTCLCELGFGFVWLNQGVGNCREFINIFRQRLIGCRWHQWSGHIQNSERFQMYRQFIGSQMSNLI